MTSAAGARAVVLVEGASDRAALEQLARRRGHDLAGDGVRILAMGGATNIGAYLQRYGPPGADLGLAGLHDTAEDRFVRRGLERAGFGPGLSRADMEGLGFHFCDVDLEDELIRAVGIDGVERCIETRGEGNAWRTLQRQPSHRGRSTHDQLHRFLGTRSGRKELYARILVDALDPARVPPALDRVLEHVRRCPLSPAAVSVDADPGRPGTRGRRSGPAPRSPGPPRRGPVMPDP